MNAKNTEKTIKICAVICEYNPFHNGHLYQLQRIGETGGFDLTLGLMSGNFTQRGEAAVSDKFTRAAAAVRCGMDAVLELPLPFAIASAEIFARGGVKLLSSLPENCALTLAFGCESGNAETFFSVARTLLDEPEALREKMRFYLDMGYSFARARTEAYGELFPQYKDFLRSPNNILGTEYAKAVLRGGREISLLPVRRKISSHGESALRENYSSASAIRTALLEEKVSYAQISANLPEGCATQNAFLTRRDYERLDAMEYYALLRADEAFLRLLPDCSEGLENGLKRAAKEVFTAEEVVKYCTSARYTSARLRRILLSNTLGVTAQFQRELLNGELCFSPLSVRREKRETILSILGSDRKHTPLIMRKGDEENLCGTARELFLLTGRADDVYAALCGKKRNPFATVFV